MNTIPAIRSLWARWALIAGLTALVLSAGLGLYAAQQARSAIDDESLQTTVVVGQALRDELQRAIRAGVPIGELVGLKPWFADVLQASPTVIALALTDATGSIVEQTDLPAALRQVVAKRVGESREPVAAWQVVTLPLSTPGAVPVQGFLHVVGSAPAIGSQPWLQSLLGTLGAALLAALALRALMRRRLEQPVRAVQTVMAATARGELIADDSPLPGGPIRPLLEAIRARLKSDDAQRTLLQQKAAEVRAAHFDPPVLARIDALIESIGQPASRTEMSVAGLDLLPDVRLGVIGRLLAAGLLSTLVCIALAMFLNQLMQQGQRNRLIENQRELVAGQLALILKEDEVRLRGELQELTTSAALAASVSSSQLTDAGRLLAEGRPAEVSLLLVSDDGGLMTAQPPRSARALPERSTLLAMANRSPGTIQVWQAADGTYQSGLATRLPTTSGRPVYLVAARPFEQTLRALEGRLGASLALAGPRGRSIDDTGNALIRAWREHDQSGYIERVMGQERVVSATPLLSAQGLPLGRLVASIEHPDDSDTRHRLGALLALLGIVGTLIAAARYLWRTLSPVADAGARLKNLAEGANRTDTAASVPGGLSHARLSARQLQSSIVRLGDNIESLNTFRRARARQGRRQARFIRHQMLQLAERLEQSDRDAVLADLERIEAASRHPGAALTPLGQETERTEMRALTAAEEQAADELGVLALGFQGLLGRVGDQYQELARLVAELREALRVKTQFIALQKELEIASKIQLSFLPDQFDVCPEVEVLAAFRPAKEVGGDFYDVFRLDEDRLAVVIADVSGKGIPAAFFMAVSRTLLRAVSQINREPSECIARLNDLLSTDNRESMFVTLFYAVIDLRNGQMHYTNAGHNPPYLLRGNGRVEMLPSSHCTALGMMEGLPYTQQQAALSTGDALFLFTDGVTEAFNPQGSMFGEKGLEDLLVEIGQLPVAEIPHRTLDAVKRFEDGGPQSDDVTCIVARFVGDLA